MESVDSKILKKNILYNSVGNMIYLACQWIMTILVVRLSGYYEAGILSLAMSFANILYSFASFGMRGYQTSDSENKFSDNEYLYSRIFTCVLGIVAFIVFILLNNYDIFTKLCIITYLVFKTIEAFVDVCYGSLQKIWRMDIIGVSFAIRGIIMLLIFILGLVLTKNLLITLLLITISSIVITICYDLKNYNKFITFAKKVDKNKVKKVLLICFPLVVYVFLFNNIQTYPKYYLQLNTSSNMLGIYSSIASPVLILQVAAGFIFNPLINIFANYFENKKQKEFNKLINKIIIAIMILGVLGLIFVYFFGDFVLNILFGQDILKYSNLLYSSLILALLLSIITFFNMIQTVTRKFSSLIFINGIGIIISIILSPLFIQKYNIYGVNYTLIATIIIEILLTLTFIYRFDKELINFKKIKFFKKRKH